MIVVLNNVHINNQTLIQAIQANDVPQWLNDPRRSALDKLRISPGSENNWQGRMWRTADLAVWPSGEFEVSPDEAKEFAAWLTRVSPGWQELRTYYNGPQIEIRTSSQWASPDWWHGLAQGQIAADQDQ